MTGSNTLPRTISAAQLSSCGLTESEVASVQEVAESIEGCWTAISFDCACCGKATAIVGPVCEAVEGPTFEISREDDRVQLTTTWLDGQDYFAEFWSMPAALSAMRAAIDSAPRERVGAPIGA